MMAWFPRCDENPLTSEIGRRLYDAIMRKRKSQIDFAETVNKFTEKAKSAAEEQAEAPVESSADRPFEAPQEEPSQEPRPEPDASPQTPSQQTPDVSKAQPRKELWDNTVSLIDMLNWYQNKDEGEVVAQEKALVQVTLKAVMLKSFALEGPAGSGKTLTLNALASVIPDDKIYRHEFGTDASFFNNADEINKRQILIIPEYQKILRSCPAVKEVVKTITEGKPAERTKMSDGEVKKFVIYPKCVMTCVADENQYREVLDNDKEDMRRFSHIKMDNSPETLARIEAHQQQQRSMLLDYRKIAPKSLGDKIKAHMSDCINLRMDKSPLDPFIGYISKHLPSTKRSISYAPDYYSFLDGCAKFHYKQRVMKDGNNVHNVLDLADHFIVYQIYHNEYCETLKRLDNLQDFGEQTEKVYAPVNWAACFEAGVAKMKENFPSFLVDKWIDRQLKNKKLVVPDVIKQEEVALFDYER